MTAGAPVGPHVLYVAWGFPPHRGPGTYRALATSNLLVELGATVTVMTADLATFDMVVGGDDSLLAEIDPRTRVVRVPFPAGRRDPIINRWEPERVSAPKQWLARTVAREERVFPEQVYGPWRPRIDAAAQRLHRLHSIDLVVATGNPYVDFSVAQRLNVDHAVPFVLDDRDSWVLDVYTGEPFADSAPTQRLLGWMLERSTQAWFVNPPIARWHRERYPSAADRVRVVENGWDPRFLDPYQVQHRPTGPLTFGYIGTISERLPLDLIVAGWRRARELSPALRDGRLRLFGQLGTSGSGVSRHQRLLDAAAADGVEHMGRWPKNRITQAYQDVDVLVFAKEGSGMVTSGKVYEYVATGMPVVSVIEAKHDARRVLGGYPRWHPAAEQDPESLAAAMVAGAQDATAADDARISAALAHGLTFRRDQILRPALQELLDGLAGPARAGTALEESR